MKTIANKIIDPKKCFKFKHCDNSYFVKCDTFGNLDTGAGILKCYAYVSREEQYTRLLEERDLEESK